MDLKDPYGRIARWMMELHQFNFKIEFIPGKENMLPDALSCAEMELFHVGVISDSIADFGCIDDVETLVAITQLIIPTDKEFAEEQ